MEFNMFFLFGGEKNLLTYKLSSERAADKYMSNGNKNFGFSVHFFHGSGFHCWPGSSKRVLVTSENAAKSGLLSGLVSLLADETASLLSFRTRMLLWRLRLRLRLRLLPAKFRFGRFCSVGIVFAINF